MRNNFKIVVTIFFIFFFLPLSFSQKKAATKKIGIEKSELELFMQKGEAAFDNGDYFRAKNYFTYCSKLSVAGDKQATKRRDEAINLWLLQATARRFHNNGNEFESVKAFAKIAALNSRDKEAEKYIKGQYILAPVKSNLPNNVNTVSTNPIKKDNAIVKTTFIQSQKNVVLNHKTPTPSNSSSVYMERSYVDATIAKKEKIEKEQKEFENDYAKGIINLKNCNYSESEKWFAKAKKIHPNASKTSFYYNQTSVLKKFDADIQSYKKEPNRFQDEIIKTYEKILLVNISLERMQQNSSCMEVNKDMVSYLYSQIPREISKYNCNKIASLASKIESINQQDYIQLNIDQLVKSCESLNNKCGFNRDLIANRINDAHRMYNQGYYEASNAMLTDIERETTELSKNCNDFDNSHFLDLIGSLNRANLDKIKNTKCFETQIAVFREANELSNKDDLNSMLRAYEIFSMIDTSCIDKQMSKQVKVAAIKANFMYKQKMILVLEDSASRSKQLGYFKDEERFLVSASKLTNNITDSIRIATKLKNNDCFQRFGKDCSKYKSKNIVDSVTTSKISLGILVGSHIPNMKNEIRTQSYNTAMTGNYTTFPIIGLMLNQYNFNKSLEQSITLGWLPSQRAILSKEADNNIYYLDFQSMESSYAVKVQQKNSFKKGRSYLSIGGVLGLNYISSFSAKSITDNSMIYNTFDKSIYIGYKIGVGYEFPKENLAFEMFYRRTGLLSNTNRRWQHPWDTDALLGHLGLNIYFGIGLKAKKK